LEGAVVPPFVDFAEPGIEDLVGAGDGQGDVIFGNRGVEDFEFVGDGREFAEGHDFLGDLGLLPAIVEMTPQQGEENDDDEMETRPEFTELRHG